MTDPIGPSLSAVDFRRACGHFLTGVSIVTARRADGSAVGITVNSFTSVSLDPPLVLICVDRRSSAYDVFAVGSAFAVHLLHHGQTYVSTRFATPRADKFAGLTLRSGVVGAPILPEFMTLFECTTVTAQDSGDHGVFVGRVERVEIRDSDAPLAFYRGAYVKMEREGAERIPEEATELWRLG